MEKKFVLYFPRQFVDKPIMSNLIRKYQLDFNILKAYITPEEEGTLVLSLKGTKENLESAIDELKSLGINIQSISSDIKMVKELCIDCSICIPLCPVKALSIDKTDFSVNFDPEKCIACGICIKACPTKALISNI